MNSSSLLSCPFPCIFLTTFESSHHAKKTPALAQLERDEVEGGEKKITFLFAVVACLQKHLPGGRSCCPGIYSVTVFVSSN